MVFGVLLRKLSSADGSVLPSPCLGQQVDRGTVTEEELSACVSGFRDG